LEINRDAKDFYDGIAVLGLIISMFENMHGKLEQDF